MATLVRHLTRRSPIFIRALQASKSEGRCTFLNATFPRSIPKCIPSSQKSFATQTVSDASSGQHITEPAQLTQSDYHKHSDAYIDTLVEALEELAESRPSMDVEYHSGVLNLVFPPAGTYVINKQPPNHQIWLSSPISGPKRYDFVRDNDGKGIWMYLRDGSTLTGLLKDELELEFEPPESD